MPPRPLVAKDRVTARLIGAAVLVPSLGVLLIAAGLMPSSEGYGTHTQLGLAPCGFETASGLPCATCGMTTAFAHAANGNLLQALITQPAGALLAVLCAMLAWLGGWSVVRGMPLTPLLGMLGRPRFLMVALGVVLGSWLYTAGFAMVG